MSTPRYRAGKRLWEPAEDALLVARYPHEATAVLAQELGRTRSAVSARVKQLALFKSEAFHASGTGRRIQPGERRGQATEFRPGQAPPNKGLRRPGWHAGRMRETQFVAGVRRGRAEELHKPVGAERLTKDGYLQRKVNDDRPFYQRWRLVQLLVWEAAHGPVPSGFAVTFINGDRQDVRLENLVLISRADLMRRNTIHNLPKPLVDTIQLLGALKRQIRKRSRDGQEQDRRPA